MNFKLIDEYVDYKVKMYHMNMNFIIECKCFKARNYIKNKYRYEKNINN